MIRKIISGGQTGADQGALEAAEELGIKTGGQMPADFQTELGYQPETAERFNLTAAGSYRTRTRANIINSDATLILSTNKYSAGTVLTVKTAVKMGKLVLLLDPFKAESLSHAVAWLPDYIETLNVAGNRESKSRGIQERVKNFIVAVVTELREEENEY